MLKKKVLASILIFPTIFFLFSCQKQLDTSAADINALKTSVSALQKTTDSLAKALGTTNYNLVILANRVDSIKTQIVIVQNQITILSSQITVNNTNIVNINNQITVLNQQYLDLLKLLNDILSQLTVMPTTLQTGLVAYYPFTGNVNDSSGNGNNGVNNGCVFSLDQKGKSNNALTFSNNSFVQIPNPFFGGNQVNTFTMSSRVYFNSISNSPNIWGKSLFWGEVNLLINSNGSIQLVWANSVTGNKYSIINSSPNAIQTGNWYDIVIVYQNSSAQIYINGQAVTTTLQWMAQGGAIISTSQIEASCNFSQEINSSKFGARSTGGVLGNYLNGSIDDFKLYNRVLTQTEISYLANH